MAENRNSSITRVRPLFQQLLKRDPDGCMWLPNLLSLAGAERVLGAELVTRPGTIAGDLSMRRPYRDRVLQRYGVDKIDLEMCFEYSVPPPAAFLEWLIKNPDQMSWPRRSGAELGFERQTQRRREQLVGRHGADEQAKTMSEALEALAAHGAVGSKRKWWAFEGFTEVDYYLETDQFLLLVEGKGLERVSNSTDWYPRRNQLARNVEAASQLASEKQYAVMLIVENAAIPGLDREGISAGLPHLNDHARHNLCERLLGRVTWSQAADALGIDPTSLPDTTADVIRAMQDAP